MGWLYQLIARIDGSEVLGTWKLGRSGLETAAPIGLRDANGVIIPLSHHANELGPNRTEIHDLALKEGHYVGAQEDVPSRVGQLVSGGINPNVSTNCSVSASVSRHLVQVI